MSKYSNNYMHYTILPTPKNNMEEAEKKLISEFHLCLKRMELEKELIIIDPYFLASYPEEKEEDINNRIGLYISLIKPHLANLESIHIVTELKHSNFEFQKKLINKLGENNPNLEVNFSYSKKLHDRYWLNPEKNKGMNIGTSLNGLFKKLSSFDNMKDIDAISVIDYLKANTII